MGCRMNRAPALVGISLSATFVPGLKLAIDSQRRAHPKAKDAELLERILVAGIMATNNDPAKDRITRSSKASA